METNGAGGAGERGQTPNPQVNARSGRKDSLPEVFLLGADEGDSPFLTEPSQRDGDRKVLALSGASNDVSEEGSTKNSTASEDEESWATWKKFQAQQVEKAGRAGTQRHNASLQVTGDAEAANRCFKLEVIWERTSRMKGLKKR